MRQISQPEREIDSAEEERKRRESILRSESVISNKDSNAGKIVLEEHTESGESGAQSSEVFFQAQNGSRSLMSDKVLQRTRRKARVSFHWIRFSGSVKRGVYGQYLKHVGYFSALIISVTMLSSSAFQVGSSFWLNSWSKDESAGRYEVLSPRKNK